MILDSLGDRMKMYERVNPEYLIHRMPIILRVDGKAFHTYTRGCVRPWDVALMDAMDQAAIAICEEADGAQVAYVQSDEISVFLHSYKRYHSRPWFDGKKSKIETVAASAAAAWVTGASTSIFGKVKHALFDGRAHNYPESDVCNYFIWRQQDATRNAIQMAARDRFSERAMYRKNTDQLQEMLFQQYQVNFNDYPTHMKRGRFIVREKYEVDGAMRSRWVVDKEGPVLTKDRNYIEQYLPVEPEPIAAEPSPMSPIGEPA